ncbi:MAG: hypothetical protein HQL87_17470 [Magnetococcales bacterium]|nr:hypothetical protein [Magnetococcales bacterium]
MTMVEEIYQRARQLPKDKAVEVLNFIGHLETTPNGSPVIPRKRPLVSEWLKPIHVDAWDNSMDLSREAMYGDNGR